MSIGNSTGDLTLTCVDCRQSFIFTAGEAEFYATKGFSQPKRCKDCRAAKKANQMTSPAVPQQLPQRREPEFINSPPAEKDGNRKSRRGNGNRRYED
jgi:hypothetical protein